MSDCYRSRSGAHGLKPCAAGIRILPRLVLMTGVLLTFCDGAGAISPSELHARAQKLRNAAARCESRLARGDLDECTVSVPWTNQEISVGAAEALANQLDAEADRQDEQPPEAPVHQPPPQRDSDANAQPIGTPPDQPASQIDSSAFGSPGSWNSSERQMVSQIFGRFGRGPAFDFVRAKVRFHRRHQPSTLVGSSDVLGESPGIVYFYDVFFSSALKTDQGVLTGDALDVWRTNLMAFESGKAAYANVKDLPLPSGQSFGEWFEPYVDANESNILGIKAAGYRRGSYQLSLSSATTDLPGAERESAFGYLFRGALLKLDKPHEKGARKQHDATMNDFQTRLNWALTHH
jgi:hypothetical protein